MFNFRKLMTGFAATAVTLAMLGASAGTVFAKSEETNTTGDAVKSTNSETVAVGQSVQLQSGREAINMSKSAYSGELDLTKISPERADHMRTPTGIQFVQPLVQYSVENTGESVDKYQHGQTYIYFDLTKAQLADWNNGTLAVYHFNSSTNSWEQLSAMMINRGAYGRLSVQTVGFGAYGLGNLLPANTSTNGNAQ